MRFSAQRAQIQPSTKAGAANPAFLTHAKELALVRLAKNGDTAAKQKLFLAHMPLVRSIASKYKLKFQRTELDQAELEAEGYFGLERALESFDPRLGFRFSTYAWRPIEEAIKVFDRRSRSCSPQKAKYKKAAQGAANQSGATAQSSWDEEIPTDDTGGPDARAAELADAHAEDDVWNPESNLIRASVEAAERVAIDGALDCLNDRERTIFEKRNLWTAPATLEELALQFRISAERVRQIEEIAFAKVSLRLPGTRDEILATVSRPAIPYQIRKEIERLGPLVEWHDRPPKHDGLNPEPREWLTRDGEAATAEYFAAQQAEREKTSRLRALRTEAIAPAERAFKVNRDKPTEPATHLRNIFPAWWSEQGRRDWPRSGTKHRNDNKTTLADVLGYYRFGSRAVTIPDVIAGPAPQGARIRNFRFEDLLDDESEEDSNPLDTAEVFRLQTAREEQPEERVVEEHKEPTEADEELSKLEFEGEDGA